VDKEQQDPLQACEQKVEELVEENAELRESAESFGALAERLNQARQAEATAVVCPRCSRSQHVVQTVPTVRGHHLHCEYCGHSWGSQAAGGHPTDGT
jgi:hypothetical protein